MDGHPSASLIQTPTLNQQTRWRDSLELWGLQAAHRLAALAFLGLLGAWIMQYRKTDDHWATLIAFAAANLGFCISLLCWVWGRPAKNREALGVAIFNLVMLALSTQLMLLGRLDIIRACADKFFSPL